MTNNEFSAAFEPLLHDLCTAQTLLAVEQGDQAAANAHTALWQALESSGFLDSLIPEAQGGAGLDLAQAYGLLRLAGYHGLPAAFATTLLVRGWCAQRGVSPPVGSIAIATGTLHVDGDQFVCEQALFGLHAQWVLAATPQGNVALWPCRATIERKAHCDGSLDARLRWQAEPAVQTVPDTTAQTVQLLCALATACLMAGAAQRLVSMTVEYANQRQQFGRSIGRFQAVQQQISVMAELAAASDMAAQLACQTTPNFPHVETTAIAKFQTSVAATRLADQAHAVHGAIGVTQEYALQFFTRRLRAWRRAAGTEAWWAQQLGATLLQDQRDLIDALQNPANAG